MEKNAKNRGSFLPSPVPPLNKGTVNLAKITEHSAECYAEPVFFTCLSSLCLMQKHVRTLGIVNYD